MITVNRKTIAVVAVGRPGEWVVRTPDGLAHRGETLREAMAAAIASEDARRSRLEIEDVL